jgi:DNA-binding NarL/FixJ family response regulator
MPIRTIWGVIKLERVVIIDDNVALREGFSIVLKSMGKYEIVNSYPSCEDAISKLVDDKPDIVLMDLEMPGMGGLEGIEKIKQMTPEAEIIVMTAHDNVEFLVRALQAGAIGYITKNKSDFFIELIAAIEEMKRGGAPLSPGIARKFVASFQKNQRSPLSPRETKVLQLLSTGKSYSVIAEELYISKSTVRAHIRNIYEKLNVNRKSQAIERALSQKLI